MTSTLTLREALHGIWRPDKYPILGNADWIAAARLDREAAARIAPRDTQKIIRALEMRLLSGKPLSGSEAQALPGSVRMTTWATDPNFLGGMGGDGRRLPRGHH